MRYFRIIVGLLLFTLLGCEKDIDIDLPDAKKKIVVEGSIEQGQPPFIILTRTDGYFNPVDVNTLRNSFIHDANIIVSNGNEDVNLVEICVDQIPDSLLPVVAQLIDFSLEDIKSSGLCLYSTFDQNIFGEVGKTYSLSIDVDGEKLTASTTIPELVPMERYWYKDQPGYSNYGYVWFELDDPETIGNSYRIYTQRIGKDDRFLPTNGSVFDDSFFNGLNFEAFVYRGTEPNSDREEDLGELRSYYEQGDTIAIKFCSIDQTHYEFWRTFEIATFNNGNPFAAPATIKSNIEGGLGVWGGYAATFDTIVAAD